jgi:hypothetical protein
MAIYDKANDELRKNFAKRLGCYSAKEATVLLRIETKDELLALYPFCEQREKAIIAALIQLP